VGTTLPAFAATDISIPVDTIVRGNEGEITVLAQVSAADLAGCKATIEAVSHNNNSVHNGNDLLISSGGTTVVLADVEAVSLGSVTAGETLELGDTIVVSVRLGSPDAGRPMSVFSGGLTVQVTCAPVVTTTTTVASTTTSTDDTTTTTVSEETTTTDGPTTTVVEQTTTTPPTVLGTSTTTLPDDSTTVPPVTGSTLPFTGPDDLAPMAVAGGAALLLGVALKRASREERATN
jgi:hypothetical protein